MKTNYSIKASEFISEIMNDIYPILEKCLYEDEINYQPCRVEILQNDFSAVWVKWGKYDCEFKDLPVIAMATIADNIIRSK